MFWDVQTLTPTSSGNQGRQPVFKSRALSGTYSNLTFGNISDTDATNSSLVEALDASLNFYSNILTSISIHSSGTALWNLAGTYDYDDYYTYTASVSAHTHDKTLNPIWNASTNPTGGLKYITRIESGSNLSGQGQSGGDIGANLIYQQGKSGTLGVIQGIIYSRTGPTGRQRF